jgi:dTDP-4-dehydrorhamnose 3,5-epimerase-like enzyme
MNIFEGFEKVYTFIIIIISIIINIYLSIYFYDYYNGINTNPLLYKNLNIEFFKKFDFNFFIQNYGDTDIVLTHADWNDVICEHKVVKCKDYCQQIINQTQSPIWYFKSEDNYDFFHLIGIKKKIIEEFDKIFNKSYYLLAKNTSFWMGPKNSTTGWHTDLDDLSYLYVVKGKKKVSLVNPKYNKYMYPQNMFIQGSKWSKIDFKQVDYDKFPDFKKAKVITYILNEGDALYIPRNWWHCVENLEDTIAITYKLFRYQTVFHTLLEEVRKYYYKLFHSETYNENIERMKKDYNKCASIVLGEIHN